LVTRIVQHPDVDVNHFYSTATALYKACENHDLAIVEALLDVGADPQKSPPRCDSESSFDEPEDSGRYGFVRADSMHPGMTPLFGFGLGDAGVTSYSADVTPINAIFRRLVAAGADINHRSFSGETALHYAARGSLVTARLLLDAGVSPDAVDGSGCTPLHVCIKPAMVSLLVEHGKATVDMATWKGHTALGKTLEGNTGPWSAKAERLLELGADPNLVSGTGRNVAGSGALNIVLDRHVSGLRTVRYSFHVFEARVGN
jgi:ankyrin repeat protein